MAYWGHEAPLELRGLADVDAGGDQGIRPPGRAPRASRGAAPPAAPPAEQPALARPAAGHGDPPAPGGVNAGRPGPAAAVASDGLEVAARRLGDPLSRVLPAVAIAERVHLREQLGLPRRPR